MLSTNRERLASYTCLGPSENLDKVDVSSLARETLAAVEADSYWCMSHLLDGIQVGEKTLLRKSY